MECRHSIYLSLIHMMNGPQMDFDLVSYNIKWSRFPLVCLPPLETVEPILGF